MKKNKNIIKVLALIFLFVICISTNVNADTSPKPSITIYLKNMNTSNYKIDLLTKLSENFYHMEQFKGYPMYEYNDNGWVATTLRDDLLWGDIKGNESRTHIFSYMDVPYEFRVIIQFEDGTIKTTDVIKRTEFNYKMYLDVNTMEVEKIHEIDIAEALQCMVVTLIIEIILAVIMNINHVPTIAITNIMTQIIVQSIEFFDFNFKLVFTIAELLVFIVEFIVYKNMFKDIDSKSVLKYTFFANLITALLTFRSDLIVFLLVMILLIIYTCINRKKIKCGAIKIVLWIVIISILYAFIIPIMSIMGYHVSF